MGKAQVQQKKQKKKPIIKQEELKLIPKKKRGRPRKEESEQYKANFSYNEYGYTPADEEEVKIFLTKIIEILRINSLKGMMSSYKVIREYMRKSYDFGELMVPSPPQDTYLLSLLTQLIR